MKNNKAPYWLSTLSSFCIACAFAVLAMFYYPRAKDDIVYIIPLVVSMVISGLFANICIGIFCDGLREGFRTKPK